MSGNRGVKPTLWKLSSGATTTVPGLPAADQRNQAASVLLPPAQAQRVLIVGGGGEDIHQHGHVETAAAAPHAANVGRTASRSSTCRATHPDTRSRPRCITRACISTPPCSPTAPSSPTAARESRSAPSRRRWKPRSTTPSPIAGHSPPSRACPRLYHSVALLTPDGKVITAGSNPRPKDDELRIEVFSPPYLFRGPRPRSHGADHAAYGARLAATTPEPDALREINLMRPGSTTHAFNCDQRLIDVPFTITGPDAVELQLPRNRNLAPPGWYMVFLVNTDAVPSSARWLRLS